MTEVLNLAKQKPALNIPGSNSYTLPRLKARRGLE